MSLIIVPIEKNIPLPRRGMVALILALDTGDSFSVSDCPSAGSITGPLATARREAPERTFACRSVGPRTYRIWRTADKPHHRGEKS